MYWKSYKNIKPRFKDKYRLIESHPLVPKAGCWLLNEGGGNFITNIINRKRSIGFYGSPLWCPIGMSFKTSTSDYIDCSTMDKIDGSFSLVVRCDWPSALTGYHCVAGFMSTLPVDNARMGALCWWNSTGLASIDVLIKLDRYSRFTTPNYAGQHVTIISTHYETGIASTDVSLYINGTKMTTISTSGDPSNFTYEKLYIGAAPLAAADKYYYTGRISSVFVYNRVLSQGEVISLSKLPYQFLENSHPIFYSFGEGGTTALSRNIWSYGFFAPNP